MDLDKGRDPEGMLYDYKTRPRWYLALLLGMQHFVTMCAPNALVTLILVNKLCLEEDSPIKSELISISFFVMGITTLLQTFIGTRLPIIQGSTFSLLLPTMALITMPDISSCNMSDNIFIKNRFENGTVPESVFHLKMRLISGAMLASSSVEIILGASGLLSYLVRIISPLSLAAIYTVLALSIVGDLINMMATYWAISLTGTALMIIIILVLAPIAVPLPSWTKTNGFQFKRVRIFEISPILISLLIVWGICAILTVTETLPKDASKHGHLARTDVKLRAVYEAAIFKMPFPLRWGIPLMIPSAIIGMSAGIMISIIESVGDYMLTAEVCGAPRIPEYAVCRGIFAEGIGVMLSGLLGSAVGPTSYSDNIGVLKITRAGNRIIAQVAAVIMLICGMSPLIGAIFVSVPDPVVGGVNIVVAMMILGVGITYLQLVNLKSIRNGLIFSLSVAFGLFIPRWSQKNFHMISMGYAPLDETLRILLSISVFIATSLSITLDNLLPGSYHIVRTEEITVVNEETKTRNEMEQMLAYDFFPLKWMSEKWIFLQYLPLFPAYQKLKARNNLSSTNVPLNDI